MKTIITFTFLLFSFVGFSQTTREEVVERSKCGQKLVVNTYTGTGNSEKLMKRTSYSGSDCTISLKPNKIEFFGSYKLEYTRGNGIIDIEFNFGVVKRENYNGEGKLTSTWVISDDNTSQIKRTIIP
jgi:hypothetical protein